MTDQEGPGLRAVEVDAIERPSAEVLLAIQRLAWRDKTDWRADDSWCIAQYWLDSFADAAEPERA
jgi:hypothetical protein